MRRRGATVRALALAVLAAAAPAGAARAGAAPPEGVGVLGAACPGPGAAELLLMPEDRAALDAAPEGTLTVTGAYTATDARDGDRPKPVGLFLRGGELVSLEFGRMDGLLVVEADGRARIAAARAVPLGEAAHDLTELEGRRRFARAAGEAGASALQSHLLIRDGALDLRPVEGAAVAERRILFQTEAGALGVWQSGGRALTLYEAAAELAREHAPVMALNLDMGGHDFCEKQGPDGPRACSRLERAGLERLSNLVRLQGAERCP